MNYMKQVAEMLGVEMGEEFTIEDSDIRYRISWTGLEYLTETIKTWWPVDGLLSSFLRGTLEIKKLPFKPKKCEAYYYISPEGYVLKTTHVAIATDCYNLKFGNCYRTREEAEKHRDEWVQFFKEAVK